MTKKGFTIFEVLLTIAIVTVIVVVGYVALDPAQRLADARNARRSIGVRSIADAILAYQSENAGALPSGIDEILRMIGTDGIGCSVLCGGDGQSTTISTRITRSSDDAEEKNPPGGYMYRTSTDLELTHEGGTTPQEIGMRFRNMTMPKGAAILNAYIQFTVDETNNVPTSVVVYGQDSDNATEFSSTYGDITSRPKTSASVAWNNIPAWINVNDLHNTPDISPIIQEIVNRSGWVSGNALAIIIPNATGQRNAESYDGTPSEAPLLVIEYATGGTEKTASACVSVQQSLSKYLSSIPNDPTYGSSGKTYYAVRQTLTSGLKVMACQLEQGARIEYLQ